MGSDGGVLDMGAARIAKAVASGDVSAVEVVQAHIARIEDVNERLNAVTNRLYDAALGEAEAVDRARSQGETLGPLAGVPVTIKEQYLVRGTSTTWGLAHRKDHRAEREGTMVTRLRAAGAVITAKTNVPQLLIAHETDNEIYGRTNNPWDYERSPGGSSGGEAALIAARGSSLGLGGDLGGSIRIPCHACGIHGLKPTAGRLPLDDNPQDIGLPPEAIVPQAGPMARRVADLSLAMGVLVGEPVSGPTVAPVPWSDPDHVDLSGLRVAVQHDDGVMLPSPAIGRALTSAAEILQEHGAELLEWNPRYGEEAMAHFTGLLGADGFSAMREALQGDKPHALVAPLLLAGRMRLNLGRRLGAAAKAAGQEQLAQIMAASGKVSVDIYLKRLAERYAFRERVAQELRDERIDLILCPPYAVPAVKHGATRDMLGAASYAFTYNVLGLPAGVVAATRVRPDEQGDRVTSRDQAERRAADVESGSKGLPVGVQVVAPWWQEARVLRAMAALEHRFRAARDYPELPE